MRRVWVLITLVVLVAGRIVLSGEATGLAQDATTTAEASSIVGSWIITATVTSQEAADSSFVNVTTFMPGGVLVTTAPDSPLGHGAWAPGDDGAVEATMVFPDFDDDGGTLEGRATVRARINLGSGGTTFTGPFLTEVTDATGEVLYSYGGTAEGLRIQVDPLETQPASTPASATPPA